MVLGRKDRVHIAYTAGDGTAWYRHLSKKNELSTKRLIANGLGTQSEDVGSILPLVYLAETDTVSIIYRLSNGQLWERRVSDESGTFDEAVQVTKNAVVQNAVDSDQTGADAVAFRNELHVLYIDSASQKLFHTMRSDSLPWSSPRPMDDERPIQWVRGAMVEGTDGSPNYGYVIDAGSFGGSGMNRYRAQKLEP
jgi:hypothetical protein